MLLTMPLATLLTLVVTFQAPDGGRAAAVAPVVGEEVSAVAHVELSRLDVQAALKRILGDLAGQDDVAGVTGIATAWVDSLKRAGARDLFVLVDLADLPGMPTVAVPLTAGADARAIAGVLCGPGPVRWPECATIRGVVVAGNSGALARIRDGQAAARPELAAAFEAAGDAPIQVALIPSTTQRRALEETVPALPSPLGGAPITTLTRGLSWATLMLSFESRPTLRAVVQTKDADAAKSLAKPIQDAIELLAREGRAKPGLGPLAAEVGRLKPVVEGDRITLKAELEKVTALLAGPVENSRELVHRTRCVNNLKQIALGLHNYHGRHNTFPPGFTVKDGKPLLSWRVHILPFLDQQQELYDAFHLDEPWDSPHNRTLISRMPKIYACPSSPGALAAEGKTTYLAPRGPATIFPGQQAIKIQDITDGTSNTILVMDVPDASAVVWTRPSDVDVTGNLNPGDLLVHHREGTNTAFGDGSVHFLKNTLAVKLLQALLTRNGGEVVGGEF